MFKNLESLPSVNLSFGCCSKMRKNLNLGKNGVNKPEDGRQLFCLEEVKSDNQNLYNVESEVVAYSVIPTLVWLM